MHEHHLRITLATVTGTGLLRRLATLGDDEIRYDVPVDLVETRVYLRHVVLLHTSPNKMKLRVQGPNCSCGRG